ncbi:MAG: dockerin type I repeat-containing protein [Acutalibacteraceae bacterium]
MKLKKVIAVALAAATLSCSAVYAASAAGESPSCSKSVNAKAGQVITANLYVSLDSDSPTIISAGAQAHLSYDSAAMQYTADAENGEISTDFTTGSWMPSLHPIKMGEGNFLVSSMDASPDGGYDLSDKKLLAGVDFDVTTSGITTFSADIQEIYANDDTVSSLIDYGNVELQLFINGYPLGDVTTDKSISIADAIALQKKIAGVSDFHELQESLGDVNGDGSVTIADAITVQKKIANVIDAI